MDDIPTVWTDIAQSLPSNGCTAKRQYKAHQIPKLKCFSSRLAVVFAQSIDTRFYMYVENEDAVGATRTGDALATYCVINEFTAYSGATYISRLTVKYIITL